MGMAASQARYLALSARKTNTEYEGQQLNQQRLNLANQSADLFNQMLTMSVPTCPDSNDFTKLQYSWSDGINNEVISDYYQIAVPNEDFNYVVTSYHYEDVYTGQSKKMNAPEIQSTKTNAFVVNPDKTYQIRQLSYSQETSPGAGDDSYTIIVDRNGIESTHIFKRYDSTVDSVEQLDALTGRTTKATAGTKAVHLAGSRTVTTGGDVQVAPERWYFGDNVTVTARVPNPDYDPSQEMTATVAGKQNTPFMYVEKTINAGTPFDKIDFTDENQKDIISQLKASYGDKFDASKSYYGVPIGRTTTSVAGHLDTDSGPAISLNVYEDQDGVQYHEYKGKFYPATVTTIAADTAEADISGKILTPVVNDDNVVKDASGNPVYAFICGDDMDAAVGSQGEIAKVEVRSGDKTVYYTDGTSMLSAEELGAINISDPDSSQWLDDLIFHSADNNPIYSNFTAVGNCELTPVSLEAYNGNEDLSIEIQQVLKDMNANGNTVAFGNLSSCFDPTTGEYIGGIYSFKMFDHTYYTTAADLSTAAAGAYRAEATASNGIDSQNKLMYYNASYLNTKLEETKRALMETDGKGRFSSVKFEDDDTVYRLNCETITDEDAYNNAMNQYYYKQEQYDKAVADINAKTEIIQAEDRELQLRLEQLGTEQTALQTEMEACQKVVQKNIEGSFKTFGG